MRDMLRIACRRKTTGLHSERGGSDLARLAAPFLVAGALALPIALTPAPAAAQQILVMVQGQPITSFDVSQRIKLDQLTERRSPNQKQALDELIDERLKIFTAQRYGITAEDEDIDKMFTQMAARGGRTPDQLTQGLAQSGISANALKQKMRADYVWNSYVRGRFSSATTVRDSDIFAELQTKGEDVSKAQRTTEFTIRQIVLVVSRTAPDATRSQRLAEANELRRKFTDCETGIAAARGMREVVVREPVVRTSADMSAPVRKIMTDTPVGQTTPPEVTRTGVEMVAVCDRREVVGESAQKKEVRAQLQEKQFDALSKRLLEEARKAAMIQYR